MNEADIIALYEKRRAEMVALIGEDRVRLMEAEIMDDYLIYGVRRPVTDPPLKGIFE